MKPTRIIFDSRTDCCIYEHLFSYLSTMKLTATILFFLISLFGTQTILAQGTQLFRLGEGMIRIAEPGQLADTLTVWGDVSGAGRYIVPRGTTPHELISYARGFQSRGAGELVELDWSRQRIEVNITTFNPENRSTTVERFTFRFQDPYPIDLYTYPLQNNQIVTLELKRNATILDYIRFAAPITTFLATTYFLIDRLME